MPAATRSRKHQTKLGFSSIGSSSPAASKLSKDVRHRAAAVTFEGSPTKKRKVVPVQIGSEESDSEVGEEEVKKSLPTPSKSSQPSAQKTRSSRRKQQGKIDFTNHIGGTIERTPSPEGRKSRTPRSTRNTSGVFGRAKAVVELSSSSDEAEEDELQVTSSKKKKRAPLNGLPNFVEDESSGDEPMRSSPTRKPRRLMRRKERASSFVDDEEEEDDDDEPVPASARKRRSLQRPAADEDEDSERSEDDDDDDDIVSTQRRRPPATPSRKPNKQEQEDLAEDLDFLQSSPPPQRSGKLRSSAPPKMSAKQKALEALKRRRQGAAISSSSEDEEDEGEEDDQFVEDEEPQTLEAVEEEEVEDDFVIEDDENDTLGAPAQLPLMFSAQSRMKPKELFKYIVEWMVQKKINPAFDSQDEIYGLAFSRMEDETTGLSSSKFKSSVWKRDFIVALSARPQIVIHEFGLGERDLLGEPGCEACGRTTHPATFRILFDGKPYNKATLEDIDNGESDSEDSEVGPEYDTLHRELPPTTRSWAVGVFCKTNAETAHTLEHWRYHLNEWIIDWLESENYLTKEAVFERDKWSTKKKRKYANQIVDEMEERGEVAQLYRDFKGQVDAARDSKLTYSRRRF